MPNKKFLKSTHRAMVKINDKWVDLYAARFVYKCTICLSDLKIVNSGLKCKADEAHRGFVHRSEMKQANELSNQLVEMEKKIYGH